RSDRHYAIGGILIIASVGRKFVRRARARVASLCPGVLGVPRLGQSFVSPLEASLAPIERIAAAQAIDDMPGENMRHRARTAIGETCAAQPKTGHQRHQRPPADPPAAVPNKTVAAIVSGLEAEAIVPLDEFRLVRPRRWTINARRMQLVDQRSREQPLALIFA